jgi:hypothetical protein
MRGLDPRIHEELQRPTSLPPTSWGGLMDCRVKPGNDSLRGQCLPCHQYAGMEYFVQLAR